MRQSTIEISLEKRNEYSRDFANSLENSFQTLDGLFSRFSAHQDIMRWRIPKRGGSASSSFSTATLARIAWRLGSNVFSVSVAAPDAGTAQHPASRLQAEREGVQ